jgi:hypothetical protein
VPRSSNMDDIRLLPVMMYDVVVSRGIAYLSHTISYTHSPPTRERLFQPAIVIVVIILRLALPHLG